MAPWPHDLKSLGSDLLPVIRKHLGLGQDQNPSRTLPERPALCAEALGNLHLISSQPGREVKFSLWVNPPLRVLLSARSAGYM